MTPSLNRPVIKFSKIGKPSMTHVEISSVREDETTTFVCEPSDTSEFETVDVMSSHSSMTDSDNFTYFNPVYIHTFNSTK